MSRTEKLQNSAMYSLTNKNLPGYTNEVLTDISVSLAMIADRLGELYSLQLQLLKSMDEFNKKMIDMEDEW